VPTEEHHGRIERVVEHDAETRSLFVGLPGGLVFAPGQFVSCLLPIGGERLIRPYSIASPPESPELLELLLNRVPGGPGSNHLFTLEAGDPLDFTGPWGTFTLEEPPLAETVFIAERTAIAPIRPMLHRAARSARHPLRLVYGSELPIYRDELAALAAVDTDLVPPDMLEAEVHRRFIESDSDRSRHFFVCGVGELVRRLRRALRGAGYMRQAVQYERW
jgi:phenol hydroxylase P5 protein